MKILHISLWPIDKKSIGGTEKYVVDLTTALKKKGVLNKVLMLSGKSSSINGVNYHALNIRNIDKIDEYSAKEIYFKNFNIKALIDFAKIINSNVDFSKYDIIHFNSLLFYFCAPNSKRVFTIHTNPKEFDQNWGIGSFEIMSNAIRNDKNTKSLFIAPSNYYADIFSNKFDKDVIVIPHAISDLLISKKQYNIPKSNDYISILVPSRLEIKQKGQDLLLKSLAIASKKLPKVKVTFAGVDNQYMANIIKLTEIAQKSNIDFEFKNFTRKELIIAYLMSDLVVLPSRYESFGYSALESLSFGKKTVLSNIPTYKEIATGNSRAFIAKNTSLSALSEAILDAISSPDMIEINEAWSSKYDPDSWADNYMGCYKLCIKK